MGPGKMYNTLILVTTMVIPPLFRNLGDREGRKVEPFRCRCLKRITGTLIFGFSASLQGHHLLNHVLQLSNHPRILR